MNHASAITGVALSPDGERAFSVSLDTTLKVWNLKDGVLVKTLSLHGRPLEGIAMLADGRRVVVVDELGYAGLIDTESGALVREYPRGAWGSWDGVLQGQSGVTISGDEQRVATYGFSGRMVVYDLASGNEIDFGPAARHALFTADSEHLWIAEFGGGLGRKTIGVEDTDDLEATVGAGGLPVASARGNAIVGMAAGRLSFYRAGARVALESNWDDEPIAATVFDDDWVAAVSSDGALQVWDAPTAGVRKQILADQLELPGNGSVDAATISRTGDRVFYGGADGSLLLWDTSAHTIVRRFLPNLVRVARLVYSEDGERLASLDNSGIIRVRDAHTGAQLSDVTGSADGSDRDGRASYPPCCARIGWHRARVVSRYRRTGRAVRHPLEEGRRQDARHERSSYGWHPRTDSAI